MTEYSAHNNGDLHDKLYFLQQIVVWYTSSDAESQEEESVNSDPDEPYQLQLPDGEIDGINDMVDVINGVDNIHLTWWEIEQLSSSINNTADCHFESTTSSFHNINIDDAKTDTEAIPLWVPRTYPGDSDSKNKPDEMEDDIASNEDDYSYYGSVNDPENTDCAADNKPKHIVDDSVVVDNLSLI